MTPAMLKAARKRLGLSQQQLANALGMSRSSIDKMERGDRPVTERTRKQIEGLSRVAAP